MKINKNGCREVYKHNYGAAHINKADMHLVFNACGGYHEYTPTDEELKELALKRKGYMKNPFIIYFLAGFLCIFSVSQVHPWILNWNYDRPKLDVWLICELLLLVAMFVTIAVFATKWLKNNAKKNTNYDVKLKERGFFAYIIDCPVTDKTYYLPFTGPNNSSSNQLCLYFGMFVLEVTEGTFNSFQIGDRMVLVLSNDDIDVIVCKSEERKKMEGSFN